MPYYDLCGGDVIAYSTALAADVANGGATADAMLTGWTTTYKYNAIIYLILLVVTGLMMLCILIPGIPVVLVTCSTGCAGCFGVPLLAGAILAAVRRNSVAGEACASSTIGVDAEDSTVTFATNAATLSTLFIVQFIFLCFQQCCTVCGGALGQMVVAMGKMDDNFRGM